MALPKLPPKKIGRSLLSSAKSTSNKQRYRRNLSSSSILSLPPELTTTILARLASNSLTDLFNAKLSSKHLFRAANDNYIFKHIAIGRAFERYKGYNKNEQLSSFIERCKECRNVEVLYRLGLSEFFSSEQHSGFENLKKAAEGGHVDATYVRGIILLCSRDEHARQQGLEILSLLKNSHPERLNLLRECRERLQLSAKTDIIWRAWSVFPLAREQELCHHSKKYHYTDPWLGVLTREVEGSCEKCQWDNEVDLFCSIIYR